MPAIKNITDSDNMPASEQKRPPLPVNDEKISAKYQISKNKHKRPPLPLSNSNINEKDHMTVSDKKMPSFTNNDTIMHADEHMTDKKQKIGKWNYYNATEKLLAHPNFREDIRYYLALPFYRSLGNIPVKHKFMRYLLLRSKNELKIEKEEENSPRRIVCNQQI